MGESIPKQPLRYGHTRGSNIVQRGELFLFCDVFYSASGNLTPEEFVEHLEPERTSETRFLTMQVVQKSGAVRSASFSFVTT